jgi:dihydrofolate reductase
MGALGVTEFVTLDGVVQGFHGRDEEGGFRHSGWGSAYADDVAFRSGVDAIPSTGAFLFGRRTYEELAQFWPFQPDDNPMAAHLNRIPKYVVTHRTDELTWPNAHRVEGELVDAVAVLKARTDGQITVLGSGRLVEQLFAADLVDSLHVFVHPLLLGSGRQLYPRAGRAVRLRLGDVGRTSTDVLMLTYEVTRSRVSADSQPGW